MLRWYQSKLASRPVLTQAITSAILFGAGDTLAQQLVEKRGFKKHDKARTARMAFYGGALEPATKSKPTALDRIRDRLSSAYLTAYKSNCMVWPFVQAVNFTYVPVEHRVMVVNMVALGWNCYLSYLNSAGGKEKSELVKEVVDDKVVEKVKGQNS